MSLPKAPSPPLFPYMTWAQTESFVSPWSLAQSGMPAPDASLLGPPLEVGPCLEWSCAGSLLQMEERLGELFGIAPERVMVTPGASGAMQLLAQTLFTPGARVHHESPCYQPFRALAGLFGAQAVPLVRNPEDGWSLKSSTLNLDQAAGPSHLFLTNPHNPTGAVTSAATIQSLAAAVEPTGGILVSSEVYMECAPRPEQRVHAAILAPNGISIGSLTKAYGLGPLRLGWILLGEGLQHLRPTLVDRAHLSWVEPPSSSLLLGLRALDSLPDLLRPLRRIEAESRPLLDLWIENNPRVRALIPPFGIFAFALLEGVRDTRAFARWLAQEHQVDVVAGEFFDYPGAIRIGAGLPPDTLREGLRRLEKAHHEWCSQGRG